MVARNVESPMKWGAEIAQNEVKGFSRIPKRIWVGNQKASLYACKLKERVKNFDNLQEMELHFAKERKIRNAELRRFKKKKVKNVKKNSRGNQVTAVTRNGYSQTRMANNQHTVAKQTGFIPKGLLEAKRLTREAIRDGNKNERTFETVPKRKVYKSTVTLHSNKKEKSTTNFDAVEMSVIELMKKLNKVASQFVDDVVANEDFDFDQQKRKLHVLNMMMDASQDTTEVIKKAKRILMANKQLNLHTSSRRYQGQCQRRQCKKKRESLRKQ